MVGQSTLPIQPDSALLAIRIAVGPIPTICLIIGLILTFFYPITREMHAEIMLLIRTNLDCTSYSLFSYLPRGIFSLVGD